MTRISLFITLCLLLYLPWWPALGQAVLAPIPVAQDSEIQPLLQRLNVQDEQGCIDAATRLGQIRALAAVQPLCKLLPVAETKVRLAVIAALGEIADTLAVEPLLALLHDADQPVCLAAIDVLGKIGDSRAVAPLAELVKTASGEKRRHAIGALGQIDDAHSTEALIDVLTHSTESSVRCSAADALGALHDPRAIDPLLAPARDPDPALRAAAVTALGNMPDPCVPAIVEAALHDTQSAVKIAAAGAPVCDSRCLDPLLALLHDPDAGVRGAAITRLATYREPRSVEPLCALLKDPVEDVRRAACSALGALRDPRAVAPLTALLPDDNAIDALDKIGDARAVPPLLACVKTKTPYQQEILNALGDLGDARSIDPLLALCDDKDENLRINAFKALSRMNDRRLIEPMLLALSKELDNAQAPVNVSESAIETLQRIGQPALETMLAWLAEKDPARRLAAVRASLMLPDARAVPLLAALVHDADEKIRLVAVSALEQIGDRQAVPPLLAVVKDTGATTELRTAALEALAQFADPRSWDTALAAMKDKEAEIRFTAIHALPDLHDPRVRAPLQGALEDEDIQVRQAALLALLDGSEAGQLLALLRISAKKFADDENLHNAFIHQLAARADAPTVDALCDALEEKDVAVRRYAAQSLVYMGVDANGNIAASAPPALERAVEPLLRHVDDADPNVRQSVIAALAISRDPRARPVFERALTAKEQQSRIFAALGLSGLDFAKPAQLLQLAAPLLRDDDLQIRASAAMLLGKMQAAKPEAPERHMAALLLLAHLEEPDPSLRQLVLQALGSTGDPLALEPLRRLLKTRGMEIAARAAWALSEDRDPRATEVLIAALRHFGEDNEYMLDAVTRALAACQDARVNDALAAAALATNKVLAYTALLALGSRKDPRAVAPLLAWITPAYQGVPEPASWPAVSGEEVVERLADIGDRRATEPLIAALHGADLRLRADAAYALGRLKDPRAEEPLIAALQDPWQDEWTFHPAIDHANVSAEAAVALGELSDPRAVPPLIAALSMGTISGRIAAAEALGKLKDARAVDPLITALVRLNCTGCKTAAAALKALTGQDFGTNTAKWRVWREGK